MFYILYDQETGDYVGKASDVGTLPPGLGAVPYESDPDLTRNSWDPTQRMLVARVTPRLISRQQFMDRLGDACLVAVQMAAQGVTPEAAALRAWLLRFQVVSEIDVADARTVAAVDMLIAGGLLNANRRAAVLA